MRFPKASHISVSHPSVITRKPWQQEYSSGSEVRQVSHTPWCVYILMGFLYVMFLSSNNVTNSFSQFWKHVTSLYPISVLTGTPVQPTNKSFIFIPITFVSCKDNKLTNLTKRAPLVGVTEVSYYCMEITGTQEHVTDLLLGQFVVVKGLPKCLGAHQLCTTQYQLKKGTLNGKRCILSKTGGSISSLQIIYFAVWSGVLLLVHHHYWEL